MVDGLTLFRVLRDLLLFLVLFRKLFPRMVRVTAARTPWVSVAIVVVIAGCTLAHMVLFGRKGVFPLGLFQGVDRILALQLVFGMVAGWYFLGLRPKAAFFMGVCYALSLRIAQMFYSEVILSLAGLYGVRSQLESGGLVETLVVTLVCVLLMFLLAPNESEVDERAITSSQVVLLGFVVIVYLLMRYTNGSAVDVGSIMLRALQCVSLFVFCFLVKRSIGHTHRLIAANRSNAMLVAEYARLKERSDYGQRTRVLYHDLRHIIDLLKGDSASAELVAPLEAITSQVSSRHYTDNVMLNALVNDLAERCKAAGVRFDARLNLGAVSFVEDFDLCSMVANAASNALEACAACSNPRDAFIVFEAAEHPAAVVFRMENSCDSSFDGPVRRRRSDKADAADHGIGLSSIAATVERYDGVVLHEKRDGKFTLVITLPLPS